MKTSIKLLITTAALSTFAHAATVTISTGLVGTTVQGVRLSLSADNSLVLDSNEYYVGVGRWDGTQFTPWATMVVDTATGTPPSEISGAFTTTNADVAGFNGLKIQVFAGVLASTASTSQNVAFTPVGAQWVIFESESTSVVFPTVSGTSNQTFALSVPNTVNPTAGAKVIATGDAGNGWNGSSSVSGSAGYYYLLVPEPSTALLGAIGALGLLRRRRN